MDLIKSLEARPFRGDLTSTCKFVLDPSEMHANVVFNQDGMHPLPLCITQVRIRGRKSITDKKRIIKHAEKFLPSATPIQVLDRREQPFSPPLSEIDYAVVDNTFRVAFQGGGVEYVGSLNTWINIEADHSITRGNADNVDIDLRTLDALIRDDDEEYEVNIERLTVDLRDSTDCPSRIRSTFLKYFFMLNLTGYEYDGDEFSLDFEYTGTMGPDNIRCHGHRL